MKKVLAIGLLFVQMQSLGQGLHANYKAQLNKKLENKNIKSIEIKEKTLAPNEKMQTPKYRKNVSNVHLKEEESSVNKHVNYKQHVPNNRAKIK